MVAGRAVISALLAAVLATGTASGQQPSPPLAGPPGALAPNVSDFPFAWYLARVQQKVTERWEGRALEGRQPVVTFEIARDGQGKDSSGNRYYDATAMRAIADAAPFPPLPAEFSGSVLRMDLGFNYVSAGGGRSAHSIITAPQGVVDSDNEECAKRKAIDASIATVESGEVAGQQSAKVYPALLAQMAAIEKRISELPPIPWGACPESLGIAALSGRLEKARAPMRQALERERLRQAQERRRQEISAKPWPEKIKRAVLEKQIEIGMTGDQVTAAWGRPESINETITATSRQEQWTYPGPTYLYFTNGALTTVQRRR
jgi:TonB C terminal